MLRVPRAKALVLRPAWSVVSVCAPCGRARVPIARRWTEPRCVGLVNAQTFEAVFRRTRRCGLRLPASPHRPGRREDLLSETFLTFWRKYGGHRMPEEPLPFLLAIARRLLANSGARTRAARHSPNGWRASQSRRALTCQTNLRALGCSKRSHSSRSRTARCCCWMRGSSSPDLRAARVLGCREGTYRQRLRRARERLAVDPRAGGGRHAAARWFVHGGKTMTDLRQLLMEANPVPSRAGARRAARRAARRGAPHPAAGASPPTHPVAGAEHPRRARRRRRHRDRRGRSTSRRRRATSPRRSPPRPRSPGIRGSQCRTARRCSASPSGSSPRRPTHRG